MPNVSTRYLEPKRRLKSAGDHDTFLERIKKTLYYGNLPKTDRLSFPVIELASNIFSEAQYGKSLERLHCDVAATISRNACISPCSLVLAIIYLDRLKTLNPEYLEKVAPTELFLVSLMVSTKFLNDDGEESEVFLDEWATSAGITVNELIQMEKNFLNAIGWEIFVNEKTFWSRLNDLERTIALRQGFERGCWFTYTDLQYLLNDIDLNQIIQSFLTATTVLTVSYAASVLTILSSMFVAYQITTVQNPLQTFIQPEILTKIMIENPFDEQIKVKNSTIDPIQVLTTGILLASIQSNEEPQELGDRNQSEWKWWKNDLMTWLYECSNKDIECDDVHVRQDVNFQDYGKRLDMLRVNDKLMKLEDQIHKATSVRIQDQMESSWHMEWTDTIMDKIKPFGYYLIPISGRFI